MLRSLGTVAARRIIRYLNDRIAPLDDPRTFGESLRANLVGLWRWRIGDYRVIAEIRDEDIVILVVRAAHRREIYGGH